MKDTPLIVCEHVDLGYEDQDAVIDVSMEIDPGDYLCIVGENGSGKSTLMKGLLGLLKPTGGRLTIDEELKRTCPSRRRPSGISRPRSMRWSAPDA